MHELKGLACCARVTPASSPAVLSAHVACVLCLRCASLFRARVWSIPFGEMYAAFGQRFLFVFIALFRGFVSCVPNSNTAGYLSFGPIVKKDYVFCDVSVREKDWRSRARGAKAT